MVEITRNAIGYADLTERVRSHAAGAVVTFLGTVREFTADKRTESLDYEAYPEMADRKMREIESEARSRWPIIEAAVVHRVGRLQLGEISVAIAVSCPHRDQAFAACRFLIDRIKQVVPIWKCENWANGESAWVHPGLTADPVASSERIMSQEVAEKLIDRFGRVHDNLRISVTDRCNIRCFYCMPEDNPVFMERSELLSFEEIERFVRVVVRLGVRKIRLTGGEPLVQRNLPTLVEKLSAIPQVRDLALTTNGILLPQQAADLYQSGLRRINIHLDTLNAERFKRITRREGFERVLAGVFLSKRLGFDPVKINAVAARGFIEEDIVPWGHFAREHGVEVRFIEYMPLDAENRWERGKVVFAQEIIDRLSAEILPLIPVPDQDPRSPASDFMFADGIGRIGIIASVSRPFCMPCNRIRLTSDGKIRNCLFAIDEFDVKALLRSGGSDEEIMDVVRRAVGAKWEGHEINTARFIKPPRPMYAIGG